MYDDRTREARNFEHMMEFELMEWAARRFQTTHNWVNTLDVGLHLLDTLAPSCGKLDSLDSSGAGWLTGTRDRYGNAP